MMQLTDSTALFQHLTSLVEGFSQLGTRLSQAARALQDPGMPPAESLAAELATSRREFAELCARGLALAESLAVSPLPMPQSLASLSDLKSLLQAVAQAEEKRAAVENLRQCALMALDRVLAISHRDRIAFPPLVECQAKASALRLAVAEARWSELHPATEALAAGEDPFSNLLTLVERQEELDDDQWAVLQDVVERSFGKPLAIAASRGKLTLPEVTHEDGAPPTIAASEPAAAPDELAAQEAVTAPVAVEVAIEAEERKEAEEKEKAQPLYRLGLDDTAQKIAAPLLNGAIEERSATLRDLIWRLIFEDKVGLAFHVARCLETQYPDCQPRLPSGLLRSVTLGRYVRHASGEITRLLKEDFAQLSTNGCTVGHREWDQAVGLLVVAAALQPTLLAPHTRASAALHALQLGEGLHELSAYCHFIADYGDKLQPLDPKVLKKGKDQAAWQAEVDALKQAVEAWWSRAPRLALVYAPAAKVWGKWLEPKGLVYALLLPVRQNDFSKLPAAKKAAEQLSDDVQIKREVDHTDREVLGRRLGDDITGRSLDQLRAYVREAVGLARRWIELQESRPGQRKGSSLQEQAEQLRQGVWSRQGAVLEELGAFKRSNPSSTLILGGLGCCRRALENIRTLFDPEASFPTEEPLPLPLLYADLLRIPSLTLNDQWELEGSDRELLLDGILDLVAKGR